MLKRSLGIASGYLLYSVLVVVADLLHLTELEGRSWVWRIRSHIVSPPGICVTLLLDGAWDEFSSRILAFTLLWCILLVIGFYRGASSTSAGDSDETKRVTRSGKWIVWPTGVLLLRASVQSWTAYQGRQHVKQLYAGTMFPLDHIAAVLKSGMPRSQVRTIVMGYSSVEELGPGQKYQGLTEAYVYEVGILKVRYGTVFVEYDASGTVQFAAADY